MFSEISYSKAAKGKTFSDSGRIKNSNLWEKTWNLIVKIVK